MRSLIFAPISVQGRVMGTLSLISTEGGRRYDEQDVAVVTELGRRVGAFIENATLYRRAQEAVKTAAAAVQAAETAGRLKDEFLATVSHELRTPLNAILGWSSVLKTRNDAASITKGVDVIFRNAKVQSKLIEDILDVSRIITGKLRLELRSVDLVTAVNEAIEVVRPTANARNISLNFSRPSEPHMLVGDSERLAQVLWNLLSNAVKFSETGGHVEVKIFQEGSQLGLSVIDDGRGIEADFLPYVFERFKQADGSTTRRYGGLGLGLAIVRHIVELHGGRVSVHSDGPGRGSTFTLVFPIRATTGIVSAPSERPSSGRAAPGAAPRVSLDGVRVLVLDDERDARDLLELVLRQAGAVVATADSAAAGFAALDRFRPHVIVSDVGMPDEDGYSFMRRVRENKEHEHVRAIALTAYTRGEDRERALSMGFSAHLGKPVDPDDLTAAVARIANVGH
jgi:signal transduction histidine kinase